MKIKKVAITEKVKVNKRVILLEWCSIKRNLEESFSEIQIAGEREKTINAAIKTKKMTIFVIAATSIFNSSF